MTFEIYLNLHLKLTRKCDMSDKCYDKVYIVRNHLPMISSSYAVKQINSMPRLGIIVLILQSSIIPWNSSPYITAKLDAS